MGSSRDRIVPSEPGDRRHSSVVWVTLCIHSLLVGESCLGINYWWWMRHRACQESLWAVKILSKKIQQMISLGSSELRSGAGALCGKRREMWGERKEAQQAVTDKVGEAGLEGERGNICLHCWLWHCSVSWVFLQEASCCAALSRVCVGVLEVAPSLHYPFSTSVGSRQIAAKAKICCCSQMDGSPFEGSI